MNRSRRRLIVAGSLMACAVVAAGGWQAARIVPIGVAYKAKAVCSGVFVSEREPTAVLAGTDHDDLAILRFISVAIEAKTRTVTASALGLFRRRAVYRDGLGCALALEGLIPPAFPGDEVVSGARGARPPGAGAPGDPPSSKRAALTAVLDRAFFEPNPKRPRRTQAVVVVHRGEIVAERYAAGILRETPLPGWSMTKSVMNALVGILVWQERLKVGDPAPIPEWHGEGDPRATITLDHLLRMSSGLRFDEGMADPRADVMRMLFDAGDASAFAARQPLVATPGTRWAYSSGTSNIIARVIRNTLGDGAGYFGFPRRYLFDPIGMDGAVLETDAAGTFVGSSYLYATALDWSRFGLLYLRDGVWGRERILPDSWVAYSTTPAPADPAKRYGAHFWLKVPDEYCGNGEGLPLDAFHAVGHEGQFVTIVPSEDAVIVRLGRTRYPKAWDQCAFVRETLAALTS